MSGRGADPATIMIEGLEVTARHGLLPEEKEREQRFRFDIGLTLGSCPACSSDKIGETVDYASVIDDIVDVSTSVSFELLERLAEVIAQRILDKYPAVAQVRVKAGKVEPPLRQAVAAVAVAITRKR